MTEFNYLIELGYTHEEVNDYFKSWAEGITSYLAENSGNVKKNMQYLLDSSIDKNLLLRLPVFYCDTFVLPPEDFKHGIELLKTAFPSDWTKIIEKQFWGYDGIKCTYKTSDDIPDFIAHEPYLQIMSTNTENALMAIETLKHPASHIYSFFEMIKQLNIDISVEDIYEDYLMDLEVLKYDLIENIKDYLEHGIDKEVIGQILHMNPFVLVDVGWDTLMSKWHGDAREINSMDCNELEELMDEIY